MDPVNIARQIGTRCTELWNQRNGDLLDDEVDQFFVWEECWDAAEDEMMAQLEEEACRK